MVTISGGVLCKQQNTSITYKLKCEKCGNIDDSESTVYVSIGLTEVTTKKCPNCENRQVIKLKISMN